jgi:hypothetical protein
LETFRGPRGRAIAGADHHDCVIDFGAGHSVFEDGELFERVRKALAPYPNVVLLLPSPDLEESIRVLRTRNGGGSPPGEFDLNSHFVRHHSNYDLAKIMVYTEGKTPEETRDSILAAIAAVGGHWESADLLAAQDTGRRH